VVRLRAQVIRDGEKVAKVVFTANGQTVGEGRIPDARGLTITWGGLDVGRDSLSPVSPSYARRGPFAFAPGTLSQVVFEVQQDDPARAPAARTSAQ
jgi:hypothetical protein